MGNSQNTDAILMLDDELDIVNIFTRVLQQQGFRVIGFSEPMLALDHFQKNFDLYSLVISDIRMPVMDGYEFIKRVKEIKRESYVSIPGDDIQYRAGIPSVKVDEYIEKPISINHFISLVKKYF